MTLLATQQKFSFLIAKLILKAYELGYEITLGQAYRSEEQAKVYAAENKGIANSLHTQRLAIDLNLFRGGKYLAESEDHRTLGMLWKGFGPIYGVDTAWGGDFTKPDGNHYSISWRGLK